MRRIISIVVLFTSLTGCIEQFEIDTGTQEQGSDLVVEATLTNEVKRHRVRLSRTRDFAVVNEVDSIYDPSYAPGLQNLNRNTFEPEPMALVGIEDDLGNVYTFSESEPGDYVSDSAFSAQAEIAYTLKVDTENGESYISTPEKFANVSDIENLYAERNFDENGVEGIFIYVDGGSADPGAQYFRYDYVETYKIIAPEWNPLDYVLTNYDPCALPVPTFDLDFIVRGPDEQRICYRTQPSEEIVQTSTIAKQENRISRFPVRFIDRSNFIISHRYSILVSQLTQSADAYNFYRTLDSFSSSENVFSAVQPGFLEGNLQSVFPDEKTVLGYFEVASVAQERIFFDYEDLFPNEALPDYPVSCVPTQRSVSHRSYCDPGPGAMAGPLSLIESIHAGLVAHFSATTGPGGEITSGTTVPRACGDCTLFGSEEVPEFWIE